MAANNTLPFRNLHMADESKWKQDGAGNSGDEDDEDELDDTVGDQDAPAYHMLTVC